EVHVTAVDARALAREATRTERRQAALVGELVERVRLLHELRELRAAEELPDRGDDRPDVDELLRRRLLGLDDRHALTHHALHAEQADAELALDELADRAHAAVAEVIDVVGRTLAVVELDDPPDDSHEIVMVLERRLSVDRALHELRREGTVGHVQIKAELAVELVAAHLREVVTAEVEEERLDETAGVGDQLGVEEPAACRRVVDGREVHARRAHELRDDHALGAVDHERALVGHPRKVPEEHVLFGDLAGLLVDELDPRPERLAVGEVLGAAFLFRVLGLAVLARDELQVEVLSGEVLDRRYLGEQLGKTLLAEPFEGNELGLD